MNRNKENFQDKDDFRENFLLMEMFKRKFFFYYFNSEKEKIVRIF